MTLSIFLSNHSFSYMVLQYLTADLIRHNNAFENDGLDVQNYMMLYSNDDCSEFEGVKAVVSGETSFAMTPESMSCEGVVACALYPTAEQCANNGGTTGEFYTLRTKPAATNAIVCADETDASCKEVDPKQCVRSEIFPSCWYRLATGKTFFTDPEEFLVGTKYATEKDPTIVETEQQVQPADSALRVVGLGIDFAAVFLAWHLFFLR